MCSYNQGRYNVHLVSTSPPCVTLFPTSCGCCGAISRLKNVGEKTILHILLSREKPLPQTPHLVQSDVMCVWSACVKANQSNSILFAGLPSSGCVKVVVVFLGCFLRRRKSVNVDSGKKCLTDIAYIKKYLEEKAPAVSSYTHMHIHVRKSESTLGNV